MTTNDLMTSFARLAARACAAWVLLGVGLGLGQSFGEAGPANVPLATRAFAARSLCGFEFGPGISFGEAELTNVPFLARVYRAGNSFLDGIGGARQIGPSQHPAGPGKHLPKTP